MNLLYNFNTTAADASHPSFFEMLIQSQMMPSLKPAITYIFAALAQRVPRLEYALKYSDELFYFGLAILERHHLTHYDGSFSENFYGLRRAPVTADGKVPPLTGTQKRWSLIFLVVVPYLKDKADKWYYTKFGRSPLGELNFYAPPSRVEDPASQTPLKRFVTRMIKIIYPAFNALYEGLFFLYQLLYMYNHTVYFNPFLHIQGLAVKRLSMHDMVEQSRREATKKMLRPTGTFKSVLLSIVDGWNTLLDYSKYLLPTAIFVFKFLEWWYSENRFAPTEQPIPPPPDPPKVAPNGVTVPKDKRLCPLCVKPRTNHAMSTDGFVFCYPCLFEFVRTNQACPVTRMPMTTDQIRKIYDEEMP